MATTKREGNNAWKEKMVISPSKSRAPNITKTRPKPSTTSSTDHKAASSSSTTTTTAAATEKRLPHYLRPTLSSRHESVKNAKKPGPEDTAKKASSLNRRRSSDSKPQSAVVSHGLKEKTTTVRSNTIPSKGTHSLKPVAERTPKTSKFGKPQAPLHAKGTIKSSTNPAATKKEFHNALASTKGLDVTQTSSHESEEEGEILVHEVEEVVNVEVGAETESNISEVPKSEDFEDGSVVESDHVDSIIEDEHEVKPCDIPEVSEEIKANATAQIEEAEAKAQKEEEAEARAQKEEEAENEHGGEENESKEEGNVEESVAISEAVVEVEEDKGEVKGEDSEAENKNEGNMVDEKEEVDGGSEGLNLKEGQDEVGAVEETKPEVVNTVSSKRQVGQGKKETQAYNDVIEETASKLLEKRKNKVKALVGAFETVIDIETPSK
ncbi:suppressor protein SRP40 [Quercus lobata]|uniref:Calmodulin-binding domain-containing protein n=1 Tax=Quercus lobata TaxID=97700 RepID=A0A7N2N3U1_QUELO|nr:suppressor protein SRP40 [Quercus lobata]